MKLSGKKEAAQVPLCRFLRAGGGGFRHSKASRAREVKIFSNLLESYRLSVRKFPCSG
jgi:hypothetical protein